MKRGIKYWVSWIGVLPISLIAGLLVDFPVHWILYRTLSGGDSPFITPYPELPERVLAPFFRAFVIVWVSALIAPEHRFKTSVVLATLWILGASASFVLVYLGFHTDTIQLNLTAGGLPVIMGVVGAVVGLYQVGVKFKRENQVFHKEKVGEPKASIYDRYKTDLFNLFFVGVFALCFISVIVSRICFAFLLCINVFMIFYSWKEKLHTTGIMKFNLLKNIVIAIILLIGLFSPTYRLYVVVFCLALQAFDLIRHFINAHLRKKGSTNA